MKFAREVHFLCLRRAHAAVSECAQSNRTRAVHVSRRAAARAVGEDERRQHERDRERQRDDADDDAGDHVPGELLPVVILEGRDELGDEHGGEEEHAHEGRGEEDPTRRPAEPTAAIYPDPPRSGNSLPPRSAFSLDAPTGAEGVPLLVLRAECVFRPLLDGGPRWQGGRSK